MHAEINTIPIDAKPKAGALITAALLLLVFGVDAWAQESKSGMILPDLGKALANPVSIQVLGSWPSNCVPRADQTVLDGQDVVLIANRSGVGCTNEQTQFSITFGLDLTLAKQLADHYRVHFFVESPDDGLLRLHDFRLLSNRAVERRITPESGWWWPRQESKFANSGPGTGYSLELQNGALIVSANVYSPDGQPVWYLSAGQRIGNIFEQAVFGFAGGQALFGPYQQPGDSVQIARLSVELHTAATATLWFSAPLDGSAEGEIALTPVSIVRHSFGLGDYTEAMLGRWLIILPGSEDGNETITLNFNEFSKSSDAEYQYSEQAGSGSMECRFDKLAPTQPPNRCVVFDQFGKELATFTDIGLSSMRGSAETVQAFRLDAR